MNTDPVLPACTLTEGEREIAVDLKPGLLLQALSGSNIASSFDQQSSYDIATISFIRFLDRARDGFVNGLNNEASLFEKINGKNLDLIYSARNVILPLASSKILEEQGMLIEPEIIAFDKYLDVVNFLAECEKQFPTRIPVVEKWD